MSGKSRPVGDSQSRIYVGKAFFNGNFRNVEFSGDFYICLSVRDQQCDFLFSFGQNAQRGAVRIL